ncbi:NAD(P)-dependent glycerol-3-phosphate dehydrogenase [Erysipelotrichaceae bacterium OH741_COT-311]|nr:NAD(P)-dependent glycerol-3-phosphate dehydrogenase [Erysipelotrichaceae bacterium OH741_COT-311]
MKIRVIGSGSWGCALAQVLQDNQQEVLIYGIDPQQVEDINVNHKNSKFFEHVILNKDLKATSNFDDVLDADIVLLAVPVMAIEHVCLQLKEKLQHPVIVINVAKGFHPENHLRLSVVIKSILQGKVKEVVSLIGPSHAEETVLRMLTCINAVCENEEVSKEIQQLFSNDYFRVYRQSDVVGAEIGVAIKNVMAIASGIIEGLGEGDNAKAALMTRGLAEITRYGLAHGAKSETYLGLTGVGDLIVTCTSKHSRNFQAGYQIGKEDSAENFIKNNTKTVEGIKSAKAVYEEAKKLNISMPITEQVYRVLYENEKPSNTIKLLMKRDLKAE